MSRARVFRGGLGGLLVSWLAASSLVATSCGECTTPVDEPGWEVLTENRREALLSISGTSASDVWAVGSDRGNGPLVLRYDGEAWSRFETGTEGDLWWVQAFDDGTVLFAGANATVLRYRDGELERMTTPGVARDTLFGLWARGPDDIYAVGGVGDRAGFIWHYDGEVWRELRLPDDIRRREADGEVPGLFKVWGDEEGDVWVVGAEGTLLRVRGDDIEVIDTPTRETLYTVHGMDDRIFAVGGGGNGVLLEVDDDGRVTERTPEQAGLLQGLYVDENGHGCATGILGEIYELRDGEWTFIDSAPRVRLESLHAAWVDPEGGIWAVGGNVLSGVLGQGAILYRGPGVAKVEVDDPEPPAPPTTCPEEVLTAAEDKTIARRWNEQNLAAIRRDIPRPGVHARNLFHVSAAMYDAWAAYDDTADGVFVTEKHVAADVDAARHEAISYAAYRVLEHRYANAIGGTVSSACFRGVMERLGYDPDDESTEGDSPRALGNRIGEAIIAAARDDGANEQADYADPDAWASPNPPLFVDLPGADVEDPAIWQPLSLVEAATQNGIPVDAGVQGYIGAHWGAVEPFALVRADPDKPYFETDEAPTEINDALRGYVVEVIDKTAQLDPRSGETIDISPGAYGNNSLGANDGAGYPENPVTGAPYAPNVVPLGDLGRVLAEYWADGPESETPPGHWNVIANKVADHADFERRWYGEGEPLPRLEWDVKTYLALNGAVHDAAISAWELKRYYVTSRPITLIRWMGQQGQSSDPDGPSYSENGLPLIEGLIEVITEESAAPGERHAHLSPYIGEVAVRGWRGEPGDRDREIGGVAWIRAVEWMPYQRRNFVTPAFPGFTSGHSTFSRAGAEVLAQITGSPYFPGGLGEFVATKDTYLHFERGPSVEVRLQWASYFDAADQAGSSRLWGGIHIAPDDFVGRRAGQEAGLAAAALAERYFDGSARP